MRQFSYSAPLLYLFIDSSSQETIEQESWGRGVGSRGAGALRRESSPKRTVLLTGSSVVTACWRWSIFFFFLSLLSRVSFLLIIRDFSTVGRGRFYIQG